MNNVKLNRDIDGDGLVLYCDGSTKPGSPGYNGFGIHGFSYRNEVPKKGTGNHMQTLTRLGYVDSKQYKSMETPDPVVQPTCYIDAIGSTSIFGSSNTAELLAATAAVQIIEQANVKEGLIKTDSKYVEQGIKNWSRAWVANNWFKKDGSPVPNAEHWRVLLNHIAQLYSAGKRFDVQWVKGHTDSIKDVFTVYGNTMADKLASIGSEKAKVGITETLVNITDIEGYFKNTSKRNPMVSHRALYITGESHRLKNIYFVGNHGKDDDFIGRANPDGALGVVRIAEPEPVIDMLKDYIFHKSDDINRLAFIRTDALYANNRSEDVAKYGVNALIKKKPDSNDLTSADREPILRELDPPRLAMRTFENLDTLYTLLQRFEAGELAARAAYHVTDLTNHFYDVSKKAVKAGQSVVKTLKGTFKNGVASTKVKVNYSPTQQKEIVLSLNIDLPDRNSLKRLETTCPEIYCITELESEKCFKYYILIKNAKNEIGIWAGFYSNQVYLF